LSLPPLRILYAASECAPLVKTGGLGDVAAALPATLRQLGVDARVLLPGYPAVIAALPGARVAGHIDAYARLPAARILAAELPTRVPLWVILAGVIALSIIASSPSLILFGLFMCYALSGYVMWAMGHRVRPVLPEE